MIAFDELKKRILYQDGNILIIDKPAGLAVHGGPQTPFHLESMLPALAVGDGPTPRAAHRLDRDTSGCLVLARRDKALSRLGRLFSAGQIGKRYWAVVEGAPSSDSGVISAPLLKINDKSGWRVIVDAKGQAAETRWRVLAQSDALSLLELVPKTGRTHQIRVHCAAILGCPVRHDPVYGERGGMMELMSRMIAIPYWEGRPPIRATAPVPDHMARTLDGWGASFLARNEVSDEPAS